MADRPPLTLDDLLTPAQAAERLGLTVTTVRQYARRPRQRLRPVPGLGRSLFFTAEEIERFRATKDPRGRKPLG